MPIIKSDEDFDWGPRIAAVPSVWLSEREWNMRKLLIVDTPIDDLPVAQSEDEKSEGEKREEYERIKKAKKDAEKAMKDGITRQFDNEGHPEMRLIKSKSKVPVFKDVQKQAEVCTKFPWVIPGSFRQDPEKSGGTLLAIKCESCNDERIIHLADAFHTKKCKPCKKNGAKSKTLDQQPTSGPNSQSSPAGDSK